MCWKIHDQKETLRQNDKLNAFTVKGARFCRGGGNRLQARQTRQSTECILSDNPRIAVKKKHQTNKRGMEKFTTEKVMEKNCILYD